MQPYSALQIYGLVAQIVTSVLALFISILGLYLVYATNKSNMQATLDLKASDVFTECTRRYAELWQEIHDLHDVHLETQGELEEVGRENQPPEILRRQGTRALGRLWSFYDYEFMEWQKGFVPEDVFQQWAVAWRSDLLSNDSYCGTTVRESFKHYNQKANQLSINHEFTEFLNALIVASDLDEVKRILNTYRKGGSSKW